MGKRRTKAGRKNRDKLRAWKEKHDPEYQARMKAAAMNRRDPETGRLLRFKNYADRELLVMTGGDQHNPVLEWMHYDDIALRNRNREWVSRKMSRKFGVDADLPQRCWYTGMQLYLVPWKLFEKLGYMTPWMCSREHLVCDRNGGKDRSSNIVIAGRYINKKLGHSPLPLKLLLRQELAKKNFDRDTPTWEGMSPWIKTIIEIEDQYRLGDHYPWQPWAYQPGTREHRMAQAFHEEMTAEEQAFRALDDYGRSQWLENFRWKW